MRMGVLLVAEKWVCSDKKNPRWEGGENIRFIVYDTLHSSSF